MEQEAKRMAEEKFRRDKELQLRLEDEDRKRKKEAHARCVGGEEGGREARGGMEGGRRRQRRIKKEAHSRWEGEDVRRKTEEEVEEEEREAHARWGGRKGQGLEVCPIRGMHRQGWREVLWERGAGGREEANNGLGMRDS